MLDKTNETGMQMLMMYKTENNRLNISLFDRGQKASIKPAAAEVGMAKMMVRAIWLCFRQMTKREVCIDKVQKRQ